MKLTKTSISLVTYNTSNSDILRNYYSVMNLTINCNFFVIENGPLENEIVKSQPGLIYHFSSKNLGYGAGHNVAIRKSIASGVKYHVVLNPDIYFEAADLEQMIKYMDEHPDIGHLMPRILDQSGNLQFMCKTLPSPVDLFLRSFAKQFISEKRDRKYHLKNLDYNKIIEAPYLSGCFMVLRIDALKEIGLFDERFFMYPEDIDLTRRMTEKYKTVYYPNVSVIHRHEKASYKSLKMKLIHMYNMMKYFNKHGWVFDLKRRKLNKKALNQVQHD
jgi:GT2 family glycosyltransferase